MSDVSVVALVPVTGRAGPGLVHGVPIAIHAVRRLVGAASVDRVIVLPESAGMSAVDFASDLGVDVVLDATVADCAAAVAAAPGVRVVLVHDPLCAYTPDSVLDRVVRTVVAEGRPVVPVLPCSDTVKRVDDTDVVMDTPDRAGLRVIQSPVGYPAALLASGAVTVGTFPVGAVPVGALTVAGDPMARRLTGPMDLAMIDGGLA
jgi:2-C-methyl-D-erythritol 4-phosphate cytidylyltransferase